MAATASQWERRDDIPILAEYFCRGFAETHRKDVRRISPAYMTSLVRFDWPGNVRQLQNVIERSMIVTEGPELQVQDLPPDFDRTPVPEVSREKLPFHAIIQQAKRETVISALRANAGNRLRAARDLGISRSYFHRLLNLLEIPQELARIGEDDEG